MVLDLAAKNKARTERMATKRESIKGQSDDNSTDKPNQAVSVTK